MHKYPPGQPSPAAAGRRGLATLATVLACAAGSLAAGPAARAATSHHSATIPVNRNAALFSVSTVSPADAWAVGSYQSLSHTDTPLSVHWDGTRWTQIRIPKISGWLAAVSAISATDAWAVGRYTNPVTNVSEPLTLHWNGTTWKQVYCPNIGGLASTDLIGVTAVSATDAWAMGSYDYIDQGTLHSNTLVLHWNGTSWKQVPTPNVVAAQYNEVANMSVVSPTDIWAVGRYYTGVWNPLSLHWNGTSWKRVPTPNPDPTNDTILRGVSAVSATSAWAVGFYGGLTHTLILHWNGTRWTQVPSPSPGRGTSVIALNAISSSSATDTWVAGFYSTNGTTANKSFLVHGNGTSWKQVPSPSPGATFTYLEGVSAYSATDAWAVGFYEATSSSPEHVLILHWNGTSWTKISPS